MNRRTFVWCGIAVVMGVFQSPIVTSAGGLCGMRQVTSVAVTTTHGLTIVPFAVPVAVPVATLANPPVMYSYQAYATTSAPAAAPAVAKPSARTAITDVATIFERHCVECHRGVGAQGYISLFDTQGLLLDKLPRHRIADAIVPDEDGRARMPPEGRPRLSSEEVRTLRRWATSPRDVVF